MAEIGIITGRTTGKNRDGDNDRLLLQVLLDSSDDDDVRTVELLQHSGVDDNPANDCRVFVVTISRGNKVAIATTDNLTPSVNPGEKEIYSTDNPVTTKLAKIKLNSDSEVVINDGSDYAVKYNELKTAFDQLKSDFDNHVHTNLSAGFSLIDSATSVPISGSTGSPTLASTADMSPSKVDKVRL